MVADAGQSDGQLVQAVLRGRREAFEPLVTRYFSAAKAYAAVVARDEADAEDVVQEAFLRAFRSLNSLKEPEKFPAWFFAIVRNTAHSIRNRAERANGGLPSAAAVAEPDPGRDELHEILRREIAALDQPHREVIALHYFAGKTAQEIAALLGIRLYAAQKRIQRARHALGERLLTRLDGEITPLRTPGDRVGGIMTAVLLIPVWRPATGAGVAATAGLTVAQKLLLVVAMLLAGALTLANFAPQEWFTCWLSPPPPRATAPAVVDMARPVEAAARVEASETPATNEVEPSETPVAERPVLYGVVRDEEGRPVPGTSVRTVLLDGSDRLETHSDDQGRFGFAGIPRGKYMVRVLHPTYQSLRLDDVPTGRTCVCRLSMASSIEGIVVREDTDEPVPNYSMTTGHGYASYDRQPRITQLEGGRFRIDSITTPKIRLNVWAPGYIHQSLDFDGLAHGAVKESVVVRMMGQRRIRGVVRDARGDPIENARLYANDLPNYESELAETVLVETGVDGTFDLGQAELYTVVAQHPEYLPARVEVPLTPGKPDADLTIVLEKGGSVRGRITAGGIPVRGSFVSLFSQSPSSASGRLLVYTDDQGFFSFPQVDVGPAMAYGVIWERTENEAVLEIRRNIDVARRWPTDLNFPLPGQLASITGTVTGCAEPCNGMVTVRTTSDLGVAVATCGLRDAQFFLDDLPPGDAQVLVHISGRVGKPSLTRQECLTLQPGRTAAITIDLQDAGTLLVTADGLGDEDCSINVVFGAPEDGACSVVGETAALGGIPETGSLRVPGLAEGVYTVIASARRHRHRRFGGFSVPGGGSFQSAARQASRPEENYYPTPSQGTDWGICDCDSGDFPGPIRRQFQVIRLETGETVECNFDFRE